MSTPPPRFLLVLLATTVFALACAGLGGDEVRLDPPTADACGHLATTATVNSAWAARELILIVDGADVARFPVPARATTIPVDAVIGGGREVSVSAQVGETWSLDHTLAIPPWDAAVTSPPQLEPMPADAIAPLRIEVLSPCKDVSALVLDATLQPGDLPIARGTALAGHAASLDLPRLAPGAYEVSVRLRDPAGVVDERTLTLEIGPACVDEDGDGYLACRNDCDDADPAVHPGAREVDGDGIDNDCDGVNGRDADGDGHESAALGGDDCDDADPLVHGGQRTPPDLDGDGAFAWTRLDWNCDGVVDDAPGAWDCDDADPARPAATEALEPNGIDDDCDGKVDEGTVVYDDDGDGVAEVGGDCNDADLTVFPGAPELADCKDNDCDATVDEGANRPAADDRYEPNDQSPHALAGAVQKKPILGFPGGHKPTRERLILTTRDRRDVEKFSVWTHDGAVDTWHVTADIQSMGDHRSYDVRISGNGRTRSGVISSPGGSVQMLGSGLEDNTGTYEIEITPREGELSWCPLVVEISSG